MSVTYHAAAAAMLVAVAILPFAACGSQVNTPTPDRGEAAGIPAGYPPTIVESAEHAASMRAEWGRLFEAYAVPTERRKIPDFEPVTHTPKSILGTGPIRLGKVDDPSDTDLVRRLLREFVANHAQLLGVTASKLSLEGVVDAGAVGKRYEFVQTDYAHPIVPPAGRLEIIVNNAGEIVQISDTAIPSVDLPASPRIPREEAARRVVGTTFTYSDITGRPQTLTVSDPTAVSVKRLVVYPELQGEALRVRLAWEVEAGSGMTWTVFVDAITGETVGTRQNFQT